jgi:hypothetical protein
MKKPVQLWHNNEVQFARLLCEIVATQDTLDFRPLKESMDISESDLQELFDRAHDVWEKSKSQLSAELRDGPIAQLGVCPVCQEPQFLCPSGRVCKNGHGF